MKITELMKDFTAACLITPINALCVKRVGSNIADSGKYDYGMMVSPAITQGETDSDGHLRQLVSNCGKATVRGHGWPGETPFVWTGTAQEFNETWIGD